jgi:hypothetical protein
LAAGDQVEEAAAGKGWSKPEETHLRYGLDAAGAMTVVQDGKMHAFGLSNYESRLVRGPVANVVATRGTVGDVSVNRRTSVTGWRCATRRRYRFRARKPEPS